MGQFEDAIVFFSDAIEKDMQSNEMKEPSNVQFLRNRAKCYLDYDNKYPQSIADLE
jgi:hypothetical protein